MYQYCKIIFYSAKADCYDELESRFLCDAEITALRALGYNVWRLTA